MTNLKPFDVIQELKNSFIESSKDILEKIEQPITKESFDNSNNRLIKLNNLKDVTLKKCLIDELGFSNLKANGFEPTYNCYKKDNKIILKIEASGNSIINSTQIDEYNGYKLIRVNGHKKMDKDPPKDEDIIFNTREFGNFLIDIPIKPDYLIRNEDPKIYEKKGLIFIEFILDEKKKGGQYLLNEEDEV